MKLKYLIFSIIYISIVFTFSSYRYLFGDLIENEKIIYELKDNEEERFGSLEIINGKIYWQIQITSYDIIGNEQSYLIVNGEVLPKYQKVYGMFSPDGNNFFYKATTGGKETETGLIKDGKEFIVYNGKKGPDFDFIHYNAFSPDSKDFVYLARQNGKSILVFNLEKRPIFGNAYSILFSSDSKNIVYAGLNFSNDGWESYVVYNGKKGPTFDDVKELTFSPDSKNFAYIAIVGLELNKYFKPINSGDQFVIYNGMKGPRYDMVRNLTFSPDSKNFAYVANIGGKVSDKDPLDVVGGKWFLVYNGVKSQSFDDISKLYKRLTFSPNSRNFAYIAKKNDKRFVVYNGKKMQEFYNVFSLTFSPDSNNFAYGAIIKRKDKHDNLRDSKLFIVYNDKLGPNFDSINDLTFSPNSKNFAYVAQKNDKRFVVYNGKKMSAFDYIYSIEFSHDSENFACIVTENGLNYVLLNNERSKKSYDEVSYLQYYKAENCFIYLAKKGNKIYLCEIKNK